jgi:hypothetical protein
LWGEFYAEKNNLTPYWVAFKHDIAKTDPYPSQVGIIKKIIEEIGYCSNKQMNNRWVPKKSKPDYLHATENK